MNGGCEVVGGFGEVLCGVVGGGGEVDVDFFCVENIDECVEYCGFFGVGVVGEDGNFVCECMVECGVLLVGEFEVGFLFGLDDGGVGFYWR